MSINMLVLQILFWPSSEGTRDRTHPEITIRHQYHQLVSFHIIFFNCFINIYSKNSFDYLFSMYCQSFLGKCRLRASSRREFQASQRDWSSEHRGQSTWTLCRQRRRYTTSEVLTLRIWPEQHRPKKLDTSTVIAVLMITRQAQITF